MAICLYHSTMSERRGEEVWCVCVCVCVCVCSTSYVISILANHSQNHNNESNTFVPSHPHLGGPRITTKQQREERKKEVCVFELPLQVYIHVSMYMYKECLFA